MNIRTGASAYADVRVESDVMAASPYQLICLLFDGAGLAIRSALAHMQTGNVARKGEAISKALDIVNNGLLASLDLERGGEMGPKLAALYDYVARRLLAANRDNDQEALLEAGRLLEDLGSAWRDIDPQAAHHPQ
ncbi:MAG TPA: flagellar export chaperone FliS [Rhodanobacteraceae bacterium]|nr:flagellar export chaperone FliS [Rhodanobacteraceae bacterium]